MRKTLLIIGLIVMSLITYSQTDSDKQKAYDIAMEAIKIMDNGGIDKSIKLLEKACLLDPSNYSYPYEIGYAYYLKKDYTKSVEYFDKVVHMDDSNDQCYQMLGNAYDMDGKPDKAIETYQKGLEIFPNSGKLYLELGNMYRDDLNKSLEYYEKGIEVDPKYPSNYYWATKIFCNSTEEMWGMLYGEMFMNIERGSKRTEEISKLLFDTYASEIQFTSDTSMTVSFCQNHLITDSKKNSLPFSMVYEPGLMFAITISDTITLESLNKIRENFISFYYDRKFNKSHPNIIFEWHKILIDKEQFECYNYWLLMQGAPGEFNTWYNSNKDKFDNFINWFSENPMVIDNKNKFHRFYY